MKNFLRERFAFLAIAIGNWLFEEYTATKRCEPFKDVWIRARFGGIEIRHKIGDEIKIMYTVGADHQDEPFDIAPVTGAQDKDTPPNPIGAEEFSVSEVRTDDDTVVSIVDAVGSDGNPTGGKAAHFGAPGVAHLQYDLLYRGVAVKTFEASINVVTGELDPASIQGGGIVFSTLTEDQAAAPPANPGA